MPMAELRRSRIFKGIQDFTWCSLQGVSMTGTSKRASGTRLCRHVFATVFAAACILVFVPACTTVATVAATQAQSAATQATVPLQARQQWRFEKGAVIFSNRFDGARLNNVERLGEHHYRLTIAPETAPINPSPWYGFAVSSATPQQLELDFHYTESKARYLPWLSRDGGRSWHHPAPSALGETADGEFRLHIETGPVQVRILAQRPVRMEDVEYWEARLKQRITIDDVVIGASVLGQPLRMLAFGNHDAKRVVLVLGRQHPPETTGSRALMAFIDALAADTPEATAFRANTRVLVIPLMNPDGVVEGHWRTNANGVDINRDWGDFRQPETRAVRDMLIREIRGQQRSLAFALDFHSTWKDIFYTVTDDPSRAPGGVLRHWMDAMQAEYPGRITESPGNNPDSGVFKGWVFAEYGAPAVTYEVGDNTTDEELNALATFAADTLVRVMPPAADIGGVTP